MTTQPKPLFLADVIDNDPTSAAHHDEAAAELRRLHAENEALRAALTEAAGYTRHPDYDWPVEFSRMVDAAIDAARSEA
jgi:hypothetical protein